MKRPSRKAPRFELHSLPPTATFLGERIYRRKTLFMLSFASNIEQPQRALSAHALSNVEENVNPDKSYCVRYLGRNNVRRKNLLSVDVYHML
jgi:hypothetical protein